MTLHLSTFHAKEVRNRDAEKPIGVNCKGMKCQHANGKLHYLKVKMFGKSIII